MTRILVRRLAVVAVFTTGIALGATWHGAAWDGIPACPTEDSYAPQGCYWDGGANGTGKRFIATGTSEADLTITYLP